MNNFYSSKLDLQVFDSTLVRFIRSCGIITLDQLKELLNKLFHKELLQLIAKKHQSLQEYLTDRSPFVLEIAKTKTIWISLRDPWRVTTFLLDQELIKHTHILVDRIEYQKKKKKKKKKKKNSNTKKIGTRKEQKRRSETKQNQKQNSKLGNNDNKNTNNNKKNNINNDQNKNKNKKSSNNNTKNVQKNNLKKNSNIIESEELTKLRNRLSEVHNQEKLLEILQVKAFQIIEIHENIIERLQTKIINLKNISKLEK